MQDWIAGTFAVLGTLMVLAGATLIVLRTLGRLNDRAGADTVPLGPPPGPTAQPEGDLERGGRRFALRRLSPATQLIGWGIVLLVVAAFAVGLISFGLSFQAGTAS